MKHDVKQVTIAEMLTADNKEQLAEVFDANQDLQSEVMDDMAESEMFWIGKQLDELRDYLSSWSIGQCNRGQHITVREGYAEDFINAMKDMQELYCVLDADGEKEIADGLKMIEEMEGLDTWENDEDDERWYELEEQVEEQADDIAESLRAHYTKVLDDYCLDDDQARAYFLEFYADERMDGDEYIGFDDDGTTDWALHKDVSYTKTWSA